MTGDPSIELRPLTGTPGDLVEVQRVLELAPDYADVIQGAPFDPLEAARTFEELPPGVDPSAKTVFGVYSEDELVGIIDLVDGFPVPTTAMLGLLLVAGTHRRRGIGTRAGHGALRGRRDGETNRLTYKGMRRGHLEVLRHHSP
ncbi:MAG: GNAT family N-acetyltransferase [Coriobacteriia bacterium]|nr:GNAT family N-acetyltransferase [Coriobacteriia bacterium]